ncbi:MAG TPA: HAMP domain-containing protein, partial [Casimicrobiaceae bacterium]
MPDASRRTQLLTRILRPHGLISHIRAHLGSGFRLGIAASLSLSFIAVAFLAVLANLIAAQGASVVQSSRIMTVPVSAPSQAPKPPERPPLAASVPEHSQPASVEVRSVSSNALTQAIDRFERATQARVEADSSASAPQFRATGEELLKAADSYTADVARLTGVRPKGLAAELKTYRDRAEELVRDADAQRRANAEYAEHFEALNARMKKAIDDAPKIFGRVLARQSLMRLRTNLDDMRRDFAAFNGDATADTSVAALKASEAAFNATLHESEKGYQRAEGASWVQEMRADFAAMVMLRAELTDLQTQRSADTRRWSESGSRLAAIIPRKVEVAASALPVPAAPAPATSAVPVAAVAAERDAIAQPTAPVVARLDLRISAEALPVDEGRISLVAWITAAVLVVLLAISLLTILSVLRPIKRMLKATSAIARGDISARVPRGGIRELDTLGVAFNDMAEKLGVAQLAAQGYQQQLESRVEERTRQLKDLAERDPLTGLPNRRELFTRLQQATADAAR